VEGAWLALGGPACVESRTDLEDADIFLDYLEKAEWAGDLDDFAAFEESLNALFALPDVDAPDVPHFVRRSSASVEPRRASTSGLKTTAGRLQRPM